MQGRPEANPIKLPEHGLIGETPIEAGSAFSPGTRLRELLYAALAQEGVGELVDEMEQEAGTPSPEAYERVLAQWFPEALFGDSRDDRANQALRKLQVVPISEPIERMAAELKRSAGMGGVAATVDAIVVAVSVVVGGGAIVTAGAEDIRKLASVVSDVRIRPIRI